MLQTHDAQLYIIECLTNLHAGRGDESYGIIDKQVQRDPATGYPSIFSTGLKGAIREFFENLPQYKAQPAGNNKTATNSTIKHIFGSGPREEDNAQSAGKYLFLGANLLSLPVRSNVTPYFNTSSKRLITDFLRMCRETGNLLDENDHDALSSFSGITGSPKIFSDLANAALEMKQATFASIEKAALDKVKKFLGEEPAYCSDTDFGELCQDLPVIARNQLENGISQNLWYEEIVPRQSRFYFILLTPKGDRYADDFTAILENNLIQIGANATVGYGFCSIKKYARS
jgi:CRISPR-associated protein Cmr4